MFTPVVMKSRSPAFPKTWWYADLMRRMQKHFCCVENKEGYVTQSEADCQAVALTLQPMVIPTPPAAGGPCCWWVGKVPAQRPPESITDRACQ